MDGTGFEVSLGTQYIVVGCVLFRSDLNRCKLRTILLKRVYESVWSVYQEVMVFNGTVQ